MHAGVLALELLARRFEELRPCSSFVVVGQCAQLGLHAYYLSELQLGGGAPPCALEGSLGLLIDEDIPAETAHTQRVRRRVAKSSGERLMAGYARKERSFDDAHAECGNA